MQVASSTTALPLDRWLIKKHYVGDQFEQLPRLNDVNAFEILSLNTQELLPGETKDSKKKGAPLVDISFVWVARALGC